MLAACKGWEVNDTRDCPARSGLVRRAIKVSGAQSDCAVCRGEIETPASHYVRGAGAQHNNCNTLTDISAWQCMLVTAIGVLSHRAA